MKSINNILIILTLLLLTSCSSNRLIPVNKAEAGKTAKVYLKSGSSFEALIYDNNGENLVVVSSITHEKVAVPKNKIKRVDYLNHHLDYSGNPISDAEIQKYKKKKNSVIYTLGGIALGGIGGVAVGIPFWYLETGIKPYFTGGIGAIIGGVFFGFEGKKKDEERAVETIRILRVKKEEISREREKKQQELEELKRLQQEKEALKKKLQDKQQ